MGEMARARLYLRPSEFYPDNDIDLRLDETVQSIDVSSGTVVTSRGEVPYDELILATGSTPRRLPSAMGGDLEGVYVVRNLADVDGMAPRFTAGRRVLIVGGGYIGLEAAAVAASMGLAVDLVEATARILNRVAAPETADYFRALHQRHGVTIREGCGLARLEGDGQVRRAVLSDGTALDVDFVIVGIGVVPNTGLAEAAGIEIDNGIRTDPQGRSSVPNVWAAGDCASFPYQGSRIRLESVPNAIDQAELVAENILGAGKPYVAKPWFWSDQYDVKLQIAGLNAGFDTVITRAGAGQSTSFWYYRGEQLLAVDAMNAPRDYMIAKRLIEAGRSPDPDAVADSSTELKALLSA
jgi:3-phenylpropionate/trans-cinnamate dioxygenase ferredoxin reductase subunit